MSGFAAAIDGAVNMEFAYAVFHMPQSVRLQGIVATGNTPANSFNSFGERFGVGEHFERGGLEGIAEDSSKDQAESLSNAEGGTVPTCYPCYKPG